MNRPKTLSMAALSAIVHTAAFASILNDTRHAGSLDDHYTGLGLLSIDDDVTDAGGEGKKSDDGTVLAKGEIIGNDTQTQQQAAAASTAAPGTELDANKVGTDASALNEQAKTVIGDPASGQTQQV